MKNQMELILENLENRLKTYSSQLDELTEKMEDGIDEVDDHDTMLEAESAYNEIQSIINYIKTLNK